MSAKRMMFWLVQINAVLWFLSIGVFLSPDVPMERSMLLVFGLLIGALLEIAALKT